MKDIENTPESEIYEHFGIEKVDGERCCIKKNHKGLRERLMLHAGLKGRKRVVIDYDPGYFCIVHREIPSSKGAKLTKKEKRKLKNSFVLSIAVHQKTRKVEVMFFKGRRRLKMSEWETRQLADALNRQVQEWSGQSSASSSEAICDV